MTRIAIITGSKGRGTNMLAIVEACLSGDLPAECVVIISPTRDSEAAVAARALGLYVFVIDPDSVDYESDLLNALHEYRVDLICLAGYMRLIPIGVVRKFDNAILNIHPALLPKFGGKGFYGSRVHEAVIAAGEIESGCTVHLVSEEYDEGAILLQMRCPVHETDTPHSLAARVLALEHKCYVQAIKLWIESRHEARNASM